MSANTRTKTLTSSSAPTLLIAEKPSVGKTMAAWLEKEFGFAARPVGRSHIEVGPYQVSWLYGHVLENVEPHVYDASYKRWTTSALPIIPEKWKLAPKADAADQIKALKSLLAKAGEVIGLGDPDQEGQLLQDEFLLWAGCKVPVRRLWLSATDDASIAKAWKAMKPNAAYAGYYWSALARSHADWLTGINLTRACTLASQANGGSATLTIGRVQTPTLGLIVARELEIRGFKPVDYFTPFIKLATTPEFKATWAPDKEKDTRLDAEGRLLVKPTAQAIADACLKAGKATVSNVKATKGKEQAPLPFSLSTLQEHMSRRFGMGVQDVLKNAQSLYEKKIASYPRTDSEYLPESQHDEAESILKGLRSGVPELGTAPGKADLALKSRAFNDKNVTAHHAIVPRPTTPAQLSGLSAAERQVWVEITKRYLLQFFPVAEFLSTEIELLCAGETFRVAGKVYSVRGWKDAFAAEAGDEAEAGGAALPKVSKGDVLQLKEAGFDSTTTKPPKRFTEGTLVAAMKAVHRYVADPKLKAVLRENVGIGTEATRANVIGELFGRKFIELAKKEIKPTALGEQLIAALPKQISAPDMTALWQQAMDDIRKTEEAGYRSFLDAQSKWLNATVKDVPGWFAGKSLSVAGAPKKSTLEVKETAHKCLRCGGELKHIKGKFGWFFGCQDEDCKAIFKDVAGAPAEKSPAAPTKGVFIAGVEAGAPCPKCKKGTMQLRTCGSTSRAPGKQFLGCSNYFGKGKAKCDHSIWPD